MRTQAWLPVAALFALALTLPNAPPVAADEGMWTLDNLPVERLKQNYGFTPTQPWVDHLMLASVSFGGGSGSFVSANGLVLTNHHVALGQLQKMSTPERNYVRDGFYARSAAEEMKCPDLELRVLQSMENVTDRVRKAIDAKALPSVQVDQRKAVTAAIEKESRQATGLQLRVIELYRGGEYWLYRSKKYTDVRLVCAPEERAAFFGGDLDNFCYPRHDLDFAFFRIYEDGKPVQPAQWFHWSANGPADGELVFVSGHPGSTGRLLTVAQLEYVRDVNSPARLTQQQRRVDALRAYAKTSPEAERRAKDRIRGLENNLKREYAFEDILKAGPLLAAKRKAEADLRARAAKNPTVASECAGSWDRIAAAEKEGARRSREYLYENQTGGARLAALAQDIVRYVNEVEKPNAQRFEEYRDSNLESRKFQMFSPAPIYSDLDAVVLTCALEDAVKALGPANAWVKLALNGQKPEGIARDLMEKTRLGDVSFRKQLIDGGRAAVEASTDPLLVWTRKLDPSYRELRKWHEEHVDAIEALEGGRIARARFALDGKSLYPDATGSLRLSYGKVAGYDQLTTQVPWKTTFYGLYDRAESFADHDPFDLPGRVANARAKVDMTTPLNFVSTDDIIGGNSGSPVLNRDLELVGLIFDGNTQSFGWNYSYDEVQARAVSVHSSAILEALRKIYDMQALAEEIAPSRVSSR